MWVKEYGRMNSEPQTSSLSKAIQQACVRIHRCHISMTSVLFLYSVGAKQDYTSKTKGHRYVFSNLYFCFFCLSSWTSNFSAINISMQTSMSWGAQTLLFISNRVSIFYTSTCTFIFSVQVPIFQDFMNRVLLIFKAKFIHAS